MCLHILDLDGGTGREVTCEEPGAQLGDLALTEDVLTCTRVTASTTPRRCKSIAVIDVGRAFGLRDQAAEDAARESDPCANWSAVALVTDSIDGRWLTTRVDDIGGTDEHLTLWRLDTGSLTGPTAR